MMKLDQTYIPELRSLSETITSTVTTLGEAMPDRFHTAAAALLDRIEEEIDQYHDALVYHYNSEAFIDAYENYADGDEDSASDDWDGPDPIGWHADTMTKFRSDCISFIADNIEDLIVSGLDERRAGADFWLTRNRHGAGYWAEGYRQPEEANAALKRLTDAAHAEGSCDLTTGDDGWIYAS